MAKHSEKWSVSVNMHYNCVTDERSSWSVPLSPMSSYLTLFPAPALFFLLSWFLFSFLWIPFPFVHLLVGDCFCKLSALMECLEEWLSLCMLKDSKCSQPAGGQVCLSVSMALRLCQSKWLLSLSSQESIQEKADFLPPLPWDSVPWDKMSRSWSLKPFCSRKWPWICVPVSTSHVLHEPPNLVFSTLLEIEPRPACMLEEVTSLFHLRCPPLPTSDPASTLQYNVTSDAYLTLECLVKVLVV